MEKYEEEINTKGKKETSLKEKLVKHFGGTWKEKETSLSEKRKPLWNETEMRWWYAEDKVREAVLRLKAILKKHDDMFDEDEGRYFNPDCNWALVDRLEEIFGEKLI